MKLLGLFAVVCIFTALVAETESAQRVFIDAMDQIIGKTSKTASSNVVNKAVASSTKKGAGISASMIDTFDIIDTSLACAYFSFYLLNF
uniref:Hypothetical secreted peptide n=1 Tax=Simulium nigrimanum TaxID=683695 RepID=D1FPV3_SIMNI